MMKDGTLCAIESVEKGVSGVQELIKLGSKEATGTLKK